MAVALSDGPVVVHQGDVRECLRELADESVQCVVTSPPYWGLRDYGTATWEGGDAECDHLPRTARHGVERRNSTLGGGVATIAAQDGARSPRESCFRCGARRTDSQLGLEPTPEEYVANMVGVFREVRRVLRKDGTLWLNLGSSYASHDPGGRRAGEFLNPDGRPPVKGEARNRAGNYRPFGLKPKDLVGIPWRVAFALQADGWYLRSDIIWSKPNPMPESVTDRPTKAHEYLFLLSPGRWSGAVEPIYATDADAAWLAALIDGEGTVDIHPTSHEGGYQVRISIANTNRQLLERAAAITRYGTVQMNGKGVNLPVGRWQVTSRQAAAILYRIHPYLIAKQRQAWLGIALQESHQRYGGNARPVTTSERQRALYDLYRRVASGDAVTVPPPTARWVGGSYYYDADAIREDGHDWGPRDRSQSISRVTDFRGPGQPAHRGLMECDPTASRNKRTVWTVATQPYPEAHFATYPEDLVIPCIKAGSREGDVVLDPFAGSGTTLAVARRLGRRAVGIELNPEYVALIEKRVGAAALPLLEMSGRCG